MTLLLGVIVVEQLWSLLCLQFFQCSFLCQVVSFPESFFVGIFSFVQSLECTSVFSLYFLIHSNLLSFSVHFPVVFRYVTCTFKSFQGKKPLYHFLSTFSGSQWKTSQCQGKRDKGKSQSLVIRIFDFTEHTLDYFVI